MPIDKVKPLGLEVGDAVDGDLPFPKELDPSEDYAAVKGVAFEDTNENRIEKSGTSIKIRVNDIEALELESDGTLNVSGVTDYENLITSDDDVTNKKYVDTIAGGVSLMGVTFGSVGNSSNKWLEYFRSTPSNMSTFVAYKDLQIIGFSGSSSVVDTGTVTFYIDGVSFDDLSLTAQQTNFENLAAPVSFLAGKTLSAKVTSGGLKDPIFTVFLQGIV